MKTNTLTTNVPWQEHVDRKTALALQLFDIGAFKTKEQSADGKGFKIAKHDKDPSLPLSPFYINLRTHDNPKPGPLNEKILTTIGASLFSVARENRLVYDGIVGIPNAGTPLAKALADTDPNEPSVFKLGKEVRGGKRTITGFVDAAPEKDSTLLLVDDLITTAHSKLLALEALKKEGVEVRDIIVLIDREQGGTKELEQLGHRTHTVLTITELLDSYLAHGKVSSGEIREIREYLVKNK